MTDYKRMYFQLAAKVADAIDLLQEALEQGEDDFMSDEKENTIVKLFDIKKGKDEDE